MSYKPKLLEVAAGGTGAASLTAHGVLIGSGTSAITTTAAGTSGQVLQSAGASSDPIFSTATFPATAGTSGNVLTSDGTNFISSNSRSQIITASGQLTNSQIKAIHATPISVAVAPGANKFLQVISFTSSYVYGGTNVFVAAAAQTISLYYETTTALAAPITNAQLVGTASTLTATQNLTLNVVTTSTYSNKALNLYNPIATEITGNAGNDNVVNWSVSYIIVSV